MKKFLSPYQKYLSRKILWYFFTFIIALGLNFILPRLVPGNPVAYIVSKITKGMTDSSRMDSVYQQFINEFRLNMPLWKQFIFYVKDVLNGQLGTSFTMYPQKVSVIIMKSLPWSIALMLPSLLIAWIVGNILGAFAAYKKGIFDKILFPVSLFMSCIPYFVFSIILLFTFSVTMKILPTGGGYGYEFFGPELSLAFIISAIKHYTLPFLSIVLIQIGGWAIGMREMSLYELSEDYVRYSKMMGLRESKIIRYVFKNAMLPQITGLAMNLGTVIAGSLITEIVFNYPGLGTTLFRAIRSMDYPLISACTLLITLGVLLANFLLDILYGLIDPRIKASQLGEG